MGAMRPVWRMGQRLDRVGLRVGADMRIMQNDLPGPAPRLEGRKMSDIVKGIKECLDTINKLREENDAQGWLRPPLGRSQRSGA